MTNYHDRPLSTSKQAIWARNWQAKMRAENPEFRKEQNERQRLYMVKKLADPEKLAQHNARNGKRLKERRSDPATWSRWSLNQIRDRAKRRGILFNIIAEDLIAPTHCPVLGKPLVYGGTAGEMFAPTVDRLVPALGYTKGNVVVISRRANTIKCDTTSDEVQAVADWMRKQGL